MDHGDSDEPPGRSSYVARAALDSVVLQQFADLLARRPPKRPPSDVPRPEIDEMLIADEHGAYPPEQGRVFGLKNKTMLFAPGWGRVDRLTSSDCPLHNAARLGDVERIKRLLARESVNQPRAYDRITPLIIASGRGVLENVRLLLAAKADVNWEAKHGEMCSTSTQAASHRIWAPLIDRHVQERPGAQLTEGFQLIPRPLPCNALFAACLEGHEKIVDLLVKSRAPVDQQTAYGITPLIVACQCHHKELVIRLLLLGADVNLLSYAGLSPLHVVCEIGDYDLADLLLRAWAVVDATNSLTGATPLHCAAHHGHASIVKMLLHRGADVNRAMHNGSTPMWFASSFGHADVERVIYDWAAGID